MSRYIKLTQGKVAIVDDEDYALVSQYKWWAHKIRNIYYVQAHEPKNNKKIRMHRLIMGIADPKVGIDHINGNGLDNRKNNLRIATKSQNGMNQKPQKNRSSKFKGIYWNKNAKKWQAQIKINKKNKYLGLFNIETEAAKSYDIAAKELFGEFARLNFNE